VFKRLLGACVGLRLDAGAGLRAVA
jgi:hypothetical protein